MYILRHEVRGSDNSYNSCLTKEGMSNAIKLVDKLTELNIQHIYCSPFIRAIQTIHPYSVKNNIKINIDYALVEYISKPRMCSDINNITFTNEEMEYWNINNKYISSFEPVELSFGIDDEAYESIDNMMYRTSRFKEYLNYIKPKNTIIVSHKDTLNCLWKHYNKTENFLEMGEVVSLYK